jgi:hypothetical protein
MAVNKGIFLKNHIVISYLILAGILSCIGLYINNSIDIPIHGGTTFPEERIRVNDCQQSIVWYPVGTLGGLLLILYPELVANLLYLFWPKNIIDKILPAYIYAVRIFGALLIGLSSNDLWIQCGWVLEGLLDK